MRVGGREAGSVLYVTIYTSINKGYGLVGHMSVSYASSHFFSLSGYKQSMCVIGST